eukprot:279443-Hanusia_phi.AAC.2
MSELRSGAGTGAGAGRKRSRRKRGRSRSRKEREEQEQEGEGGAEAGLYEDDGSFLVAGGRACASTSKTVRTNGGEAGS